MKPGGHSHLKGNVEFAFLLMFKSGNVSGICGLREAIMCTYYVVSKWDILCFIGMKDEREKKESEMYGGCLVKNSKHIFDLIDDNFT